MNADAVAALASALYETDPPELWMRTSTTAYRERATAILEIMEREHAALAAAPLPSEPDSFFAVERPYIPGATSEDLKAYELAVQRLRIVYAIEQGRQQPCPVPSSVTGRSCLLYDGHPQDSPTRFHRYRYEVAPLPSDTPADGLDVCDCEPEHVWPCATIPRCDEPGCERETSCGFPTPAGYRRTCGDHYRAALALTKEPRSGADR